MIKVPTHYVPIITYHVDSVKPFCWPPNLFAMFFNDIHHLKRYAQIFSVWDEHTPTSLGI